ncbi:MFS transporter [Streptomyces ipomoeae]|uniref:MFS transporter n=1 Tax=Streptomyces ipomoeae TaxID=103232 RepID=UPI0038D43FD6
MSGITTPTTRGPASSQPPLTRPFHPSAQDERGSLGQVGWVASSVYIGSFLGALVGGRLADRHGRRPVLFVSAVIYSLGSLATQGLLHDRGLSGFIR